MTAKRRCSNDVWGGYRFHQCTRPATVERDGKWWCWQHDPERVEADKKNQRAAWAAKADRQADVWERRARNARLGPLVTEELAELLEDLATHVPYTLHTGTGIATQARATAARIRETLRG